MMKNESFKYNEVKRGCYVMTDQNDLDYSILKNSGASNPQIRWASGPRSKLWIQPVLPIPQLEPLSPQRAPTNLTLKPSLPLLRRLAIGSPLCTRDSPCLKHSQDWVLIDSWVLSFIEELLYTKHHTR
ncbi:zinc finger protein 518A isoform 2-T9 [Hipposideros larvatus]|uniref:Zinc finger protein 518A isoform X2 n=1 Tax=Hipposideros armiger TaxID=186990 RepID=A0A8B7R3C6_HIPAR|nr:PREDICTED: zinc finger protein 518A isoform X2 [Hipposideros armiger]